MTKRSMKFGFTIPTPEEDADVLDALKATGPGWQTRINDLLRDAVRRGRV